MSPDDPVIDPSPLVEGVLRLLEDAGAPTELNDSIVRIIEWWEAGAHEINYSSGSGFLLIGSDPARNEVIINLDKDRTGHINFSPSQARHLAFNLLDKAKLLDGLPLTHRG